MGEFICLHCGMRFGDTTAKGSSGICPSCWRWLRFRKMNQKKERVVFDELVATQRKITFANKRLEARKKMFNRKRTPLLAEKLIEEGGEQN